MSWDVNTSCVNFWVFSDFILIIYLFLVISHRFHILSWFTSPLIHDLHVVARAIRAVSSPCTWSRPLRWAGWVQWSTSHHQPLRLSTPHPHVWLWHGTTQDQHLKARQNIWCQSNLYSVTVASRIEIFFSCIFWNDAAL